MIDSNGLSKAEKLAEVAGMWLTKIEEAVFPMKVVIIQLSKSNG